MTDKIFAGKVALVTGASRGIGKAIAVAFANRGAMVYINYLANEGAAKEVLKIITDAGGVGKLKQFNVACSEETARAIDEIIKEPEAHHDEGKLDILVNNAGITKDTLIVRLKSDDIESVLNTNLIGAMNTMKSAVKHMMKARSGRIINMTSIIGQIGNPGQATYAASKAALIGLTKAAAKELASRNITVNAVAPGYIDTDMTKDMPEDLKDKLQEQIPLGRIGTPEDVASAVVFLASDAAGYITGEIINVNGGII